jgi:hypothetical protein
MTTFSPRYPDLNILSKFTAVLKLNLASAVVTGMGIPWQKKWKKLR